MLHGYGVALGGALGGPLGVLRGSLGRPWGPLGSLVVPWGPKGFQRPPKDLIGRFLFGRVSSEFC